LAWLCQTQGGNLQFQPKLCFQMGCPQGFGEMLGGKSQLAGNVKPENKAHIPPQLRFTDHIAGGTINNDIDNRVKNTYPRAKPLGRRTESPP